MTASLAMPAHHAPRAAGYKRLGYWTSEPVPDRLTAAARRTPEKIALVDRDQRIPYDALQRTVRRLAAGFWSLGVRPGDVVAIQLPSWKEFAYAQQAAARIGAVYLPLIPQLRSRDMEHILRVSKAALVVVPPSYKDFDHAAMAIELRRQLPDLRHVLVVGDEAPAGATTLDAFLQHDWEREHGAQVDQMAVDPDEIACMLFTSGTEALPKGVLHSYNTMTYGMRVHTRDFNLTAEDVFFTCSPVGHATGALFGVEFGLSLGAKVVLQDQWNPERAVELIARERCTTMWGAATFYTDLVDAKNLPGHDISHLRIMWSAGAPIPRELVDRVRERVGGQLLAAYGSSEGLNITMNRLGDPLAKITGSDGRFNPGVEYKLVDEARQLVPAGHAGEIAYRGPNVCMGYLDAEQSARAFDADGYYYSGDLGVVDADGYVRIVGRRKEIIIRGGENISPAEIEDLLYRHPKISASAVVGFPHPRLGETACAAVILKPGETLTLAELTQFLQAQGVARYKFPERLEIVAELPRTPTGKLRRNALRDDLLARMAATREH